MSEEEATSVRNSGVPAQLHARLFATPATSGLPGSFPESSATAGSAEGANLGPPWAGVCLSGGGSRALSAAMGELRGLAALGLLPRIGWLSTVSGGTWAGTLFNWAPLTWSDATLLGPLVLDPGRLRWESGNAIDNLALLDPHAIGSVSTRLGLKAILAKAIELYQRGVPVGELWPRAIGEIVLAPFDLGDSPARYFTWMREWLERGILPENPGLRSADFVVSRPDRPYLITNSTLFYPPNPPASLAAPARPGRAGSAWEVGYEFETTPLSAGIPPGFPLGGPPKPNQPESSDLGGGWIDPFAMGSIAPSSIIADGRFHVPAPPLRFRLSDLAGLSSVAFVYDVLDLAHQSGIHFLDDMVPGTVYWPVLNAGSLPRNAARPYLFGDGGNLENQGLMPLLRRNLRKIIAFVNTETQLSMSGSEVVVDSDLPPLFGLEWSGAAGRYVPIAASSPFRFNQVFARPTFDDLRRQLWNRAQVGATAMAVQRGMTILPNIHYGVAGGTTDILWIYLHPVNAWYRQLHDTTRLAMELEPLDYAMFPNYETVAQLHLNAHQVNLLAHLTSWNVASEVEVGGFKGNAAVVRGFLRS